MILEYDCPVDGIDYDVEVAPEDMFRPFYCHGCCQMHTAASVAVNMLDDNGTFIRNALMVERQG